jgi:hypothetical protein
MYLAAALSALTILPAIDGWKDLNGDTAPAIEAKSWLNTGAAPPTADDLRGKVVVLEFFTTW